MIILIIIILTRILVIIHGGIRRSTGLHFGGCYTTGSVSSSARWGMMDRHDSYRGQIGR